MKVSDLEETNSLELYEAAAKLVGNWQSFDSFIWPGQDRIADAQLWCIVYTQNRDSSALTRANAIAIDKLMERFLQRDNPFICPENHSHWACGWIEGYAIQVCKKKTGSKLIGLTAPFKRWIDIQASIQDYPILDEDLYTDLCIEEIYDYALREINYFLRTVRDNTLTDEQIDELISIITDDGEPDPDYFSIDEKHLMETYNEIKKGDQNAGV